MGSKQLEAVGSHGKGELAKLFPREVITVLDPRHFMHGKVNLSRYEYEGDSTIAQENREQVQDIRAVGVKFPGFIWAQKQPDGTTLNHVVAGTRRTLSLTRANPLRIEDGLEEVTMLYDFRFGLTLEAAIELWRMENQDRAQNDWLTKIEGAKAQRELGVPDDVLLKKWRISSQAVLTRMLKEDGILSACPELKTALARDKIDLGKALSIADLKTHDAQRKALEAGKRARVKHDDGPLSACKIRRVGGNFADVAKAHGIENLTASGVGNILRYVGGDRGALHDMPKLRKLLDEILAAKKGGEA
jgi:hypothetical protein